MTPPEATPLKPPAVDLACNAGPVQCAGECPTLPTWGKGDGPGDFDNLLGLAPADKLVLDTCAAKLKACQACIQRGIDRGVIR